MSKYVAPPVTKLSWHRVLLRNRSVDWTATPTTYTIGKVVIAFQGIEKNVTGEPDYQMSGVAS